MAGELVVQLWKAWGLQALVLLSFTLQVVLLILAEFRRSMDSGVLRAFLWPAYMLADSTAIYVLGHLSVSSRSPEHQLMAFWAPFLLLHLGGQDSITAYAIEDNELWLRHLQTLAVQVAAAAYVLYESFVLGIGQSSPSLLLPAAVIMFAVGVVKYGERVWALKRAGSSASGSNYRQFDRLEATAVGPRRSPRDTEDFLSIAHRLLPVPMDLLKGPSTFVDLHYGTTAFEGEELYKVSEMQLSLMHDVFYTKAEVTHTWCGLFIRVFSPLGTASALSLFLLLLGDDDRHKESSRRYSRVDVDVTYVLLVGAVILETTSALRALFSSWTCALLEEREQEKNKEEKENGLLGTEATEDRSNADSLRDDSELPASSSEQGRDVWHFLARILASLRRLVHAADWRKRYWSGSIGQHDLIQLCSRSSASKRSKIARWLGVEDPWNLFAYSFSIPVSECVKKLLVSQVLKGTEDTLDSSPGHIRNSRGRAALKNKSRRLFEELGWSVLDIEFDESILVWHIATSIYLYWYKKQAETSGGSQDDSEAAEELSNYMLFLLAARTYMLPPPASRNAYVHVCHFLTFLEPKSPEDLADLLQRNGNGLNTGSCTGSTFHYQNILDRATQLGAELIGEDLPPADLLELISQVWVEMLFYAGHRCSAYSHAKQLSNGGELITVAALLMEHVKRRTTIP